MKRHPAVTELALAASGDVDAVQGWLLRRHMRNCADCHAAMESFAGLRRALLNRTSADELPSVLSAAEWEGLAREMRANIRLGLEAGECVRGAGTEVRWNFRPALAMASLLLLGAAGFFLRGTGAAPVASAVVPVLASSDAGIEFRSGDTSLMLLNRNGAVADQTVRAQGEIRSRYIDGDTGAVTINNVYLQ